MLLTDERSREVADRIRNAVEQALAARNLSARRASMDVVGHDGLIRDIRAGRIPSVDRVEALFQYLGLEAYFGPKRRPPAQVLSEPGSNVVSADEPPSGFLTIPWAEALPGSGSAPICFSRRWLADHGLTADFLTAAQPDAVEIEGVPVEDTLALLDNRAGLRTGHGLWCYRARGKIRVSHVTFSAQLIILHGARAEDRPQIIEPPASSQVGFLGKVVWLGQSIPLKGEVR